MNIFNELFADESAATAVEYAVMLAMILLTIFAAIAAFGSATGGMFTNIETEMSDHGVK